MEKDFIPQELASAPLDECDGTYNPTGGRVFYINPTHHVASLLNPNVANVLRNATRFVSPSKTGPISVLIFASTLDRAQAIYDDLSSESDILPVMTTNQNDLLSLPSYDVVIVHSNAEDFDSSVEQSLADFHSSGGGVIGSHDVIWQGTNNPILENVFGATARGDGNTLGDGWFLGTVTYLKALDHPITINIADSWSLPDEQYYFDVEFKRCMLVLLETNHSGDLIPIAWTLPLPEIDAPINLSATIIGNDIRLEWDNSNLSQVAYNLVYRDVKPDGFNFSYPHYSTASDSNPLRQYWLDVGAASNSSPREYYYIVQAVGKDEIKSPTSLTIGKWTKHLDEGANAISLPLKPLLSANISWYANDIPKVKTFDWIDVSGKWVRYDHENPNAGNDTTATLGSTYQLVLYQETNYTFIGYPGTMIRSVDRLGNSSLFQKSLTLEIQGNSVALTWMNIENTTRYNIYRTTDRESLYDFILDPIETTGSTSFRDVNVLDGFSGELHYTVIPEDDYCGLGSSTFSRGVAKKTFRGGSQSFALELKPLQEHLLSWHTSQIDGVIGIVYMVKSYWRLHAWEMPPNVYDTIVTVSKGYQILVEGESTSFIYLGK